MENRNVVGFLIKTLIAGNYAQTDTSGSKTREEDS